MLRSRSRLPSLLAAALSLTLAGCGPHPSVAQLSQFADAVRMKAEDARAKSPVCLDRVAQKEADLARAQYPESSTDGQWLLDRSQFLARQTWPAFDQNHDGAIDFEEYLSMQWAFYLAYRSGPNCALNKSNYIRIFLGVPNTPTSGWNVPYEAQVYSGLFDSLDLERKGFITKEDIRLRAHGEFAMMDRDRNGVLSPAELGPAYEPRPPQP